MRFQLTSTVLLSFLLSNNPIVAFTAKNWGGQKIQTRSEVSTSSSSQLYQFVSVGLGPEDQKKEGERNAKKELVAGVDYEVPDHESYRTSRRSRLDEKCDEWFGSLLGSADDKGVLGSLADEARDQLLTPVPLLNEERLPRDHEEWTPYVSTKLPWTPLTPSFGLEEFGLPVPRRNAETWRHFDVPNMVEQDYSGSVEGNGSELELSEEEVATYKETLLKKGSWLEDDACHGRLVYINGRFAPQLSKTSDVVNNVDNIDGVSEEIQGYLGRLTDGFTDKLAADVPIGDDEYWTSYKKLSGPDHNMGEATCQFAINSQQGTACFAALNTRRTGAVAHIHVPEGFDSDVDENDQPKPILLVNAVTSDGGAASGSAGVAMHPRCLVVAEASSKLSFVQSSVDLDTEKDHVPKFYNGYTQIFVKEDSNVTHSLLEESGGLVTASVEKSDDDFEEGEVKPRQAELERPASKDTHFETVDAHVMGDRGSYESTLLSVGGSGRIRFGFSVSLLRPETRAKVNGFSLSGGTQRTDVKTNIHHIAQGTSSEQLQKNMIGGRATGAFRGRIRVEQSAQQTDSQQLSRTILLTDKCRAWGVPSLEIIADDVECTHGATVSDLSEEELFYLRSRGLDTTLARNLLMYAFADDVCECVDPSMLEALGQESGLQRRVIERMENLVPTGERAVKWEYQSS